MEKRQRGRAIIINNERFASDNFATRDGSEKDVVVLDRLFSQLGFLCVKFEDLTTQVIKSY